MIYPTLRIIRDEHAALSARLKSMPGSAGTHRYGRAPGVRAYECDLAVRELRHQLIAWELLGETRMLAFEAAGQPTTFSPGT